MKRQLCLAVALLSFWSTVFAQLDALIKQNVRNATTSYNQLVTEQGEGTPQLWIHVRNDSQRRLVADNLPWFKGIKLSGKELMFGPFR
jgi:hypothetical protein